MTSEEKRRQLVLLLLNGIIFLNVLMVASNGVVHGAGIGQNGDGIIGIRYFIPYTMDSNLLAGLSSLVLVLCGIRNLRTGRAQTPRWAVTFQMISTTCLTLTFVIAATFLGLLKVLLGEGYFTMFAQDMFYFHLIDPLCAFFSFVCFNRQETYRRRYCLIAAIPTAIYAVVYFLMVVVFQKWDDFYGFTLGGQLWLAPLALVLIPVLAAVVARVLIRLHNPRRPADENG